MSSLKRTNLASSEHGQLKAPDKWETSPKTTNASAANTTDTCDTMSASAAKTKNLDLDDTQLKNLLDEAYSYKGPKDKENKSEIFKELLHKAELEDQQQDSFFTSRQFRGNNRRHHTGGSLQDLVDSVNNEQLLDCDYMGAQARRHQQHSRYTKNSTSVSSRQREGGSLPNNVNASSCYPISSFQLSKYPKSATKSSAKKQQDTVHDYERNAPNHQYHHRNPLIGDSVSYSDEVQSSIPSTSASITSDKVHTVINIDDPDETRHLLAHDHLAQDTSETVRDDGTELVSIKKQRAPTMNFTSTNVKDIGESSRQNCHVDQQIQFLRYQTPSTVESAQLGNKVFAKSAFDPKYTSNRHVHLNQIQVNQNKLDENGNAILPKPATTTLTPNQSKLKSKRSKADRNTTTWTVPQDNEYNIDTKVAFIENKDTTKKANIINVNKNNLSVTERSRKDKKTSKKELNRLKKSTSMEELKSSSKIEEEIAQSERAQVSLRQKQLQQQQNAQKRNSTADTKDLTAKQLSNNNNNNNNKRGERRSWGTEELNDFEGVEERDIKKQKETKSNVKNAKKLELIATSTNASTESIPTTIEAAEFHVVTKKKKTKKRQILEEAKAKQQQMNQRDQGPAHGRQTNYNNVGGRHYQPSSTYTNDHEIYVNSPMAKENRRKSTSSVPPSDKSDSSDLDSVHSLPIESTTTSTSLISYAEIARKANQTEKLSNVNAWPAVSQNGNKTNNNNESSENSNTSTSSSSTISTKSHSSNRSNDTIKASSPIEEKLSQLNVDESKCVDAPKSQPFGECVKNQLQKSKSCDSEKYSNAMSLDQFPGLEKTVKPQKSQPNFASVLTSPPPLPTAPIAQPLPTPPQQQTVPVSALPSSHEKPNKGPIAKKSIANIVEANHPKEILAKVQKPIEEKTIEMKPAIDMNATKLVFVQNSAKAEEIANSDSSNLFVSINSTTSVKKPKKLSNANSMSSNAFSKSNNHSQRTVRQTAVIFSDRETNHENVSPLLFGDFNDDILQLMKQDEENHTDDEQTSSTINDPTVNHRSGATYESADLHAINDCHQSQPNIRTPITSSQSDPAYASAHRTTVPTESHAANDIHQIHTENHVGNSTIADLSSKKSNVTKKSTLNKINVNNQISDVVSNQSLNNNTNNNNNNNNNNSISIGDTTVKSLSVTHQQSNSDSDSLNNNNINTHLTNDKIQIDDDVLQTTTTTKHSHLMDNSGEMMSAQNHVHSTVSKTTNYQPKTGVIAYDNVNSKPLDTFTNGPHVVSSSTSNKLSSTENEVVPVDSHPANVPHKNASNHAENRVHNHNHNDIVNFVGSAWEEIKYGRASYFSGQ